MADPLDERLARIEERLAALEHESARPVAVDPETFWVLEGLRDQAADPGTVIYAGSVRTAQGPVEWQYAHDAADLLAEDLDAEPVAARMAALGHPARLGILTAVLRGHDRTSDLGELLDLGTSGQVYHHVKALTAAGWLRPARRGRLTVPAERVVPLLTAMGACS